MWKLNIINADLNHVLSWADYAHVPSDPTRRGNTASTDFPDRVFTPSPADGVITIDFRVDKSKSWVLSSWALAGHNPDPVLIHEQGHYRIGLLIVRDLITLAPKMGQQDGIELINTLSSRWRGLDFGVAGCYERSTDLGRNALNQAKWNELLGLLLFTTPPSSESLVRNANELFGCGAS
jgi:hypothetical protein